MRKKICFYTVLFAVMTSLALPPSLSQARAQENDNGQPAFFTFLNDVPLMSGLTELPDETVAFDKPGGRIIESTAYAEDGGPTVEDIEAFYSRTLPHLGWRQVGSGTFWRQDEILQVEVEEDPAGKQVFVTVMPAR